jgi:hypothetical protein
MLEQYLKVNKDMAELEFNKEQLQQFKEKIKGKVVVLYGQAWIGKSLFSLTLSNLFTHTKVFLVDRNYPQEFFTINKNANIVEIENPRQLDLALSKESSLDDKVIIIDSITTLQTSFIKESYFSPRAYLEYNNFSDKIAKKLTELTPKTTSLLIAHEKIKDWTTQETVPRINWTMLRNTDMLIRMFKENGKRKIKIVAKRELPTKVEWYFE